MRNLLTKQLLVYMGDNSFKQVEAQPKASDVKRVWAFLRGADVLSATSRLEEAMFWAAQRFGFARVHDKRRVAVNKYLPPPLWAGITWNRR